ncbi:hypothetical protein [Burkholderia sp. Bp8998]|uniref:hypothetical protein n=1 Tax=Burkholderia sp. Bp8998 TaxID=2184557 RepID=UPI0021AB945F|nr:hypothetical protein [Burkholderia sp. Bp8998]
MPCDTRAAPVTVPAARGRRPTHAARAAGQPPLAPAGAEAAPGMLAAPPAAPLPGMPDGAVEGAGAMPLVALELVPVPVSLSLFF